MYFTNIYDSSLDMVLDGVVAALDVLGLPVKSGLLSYEMAPVLSQKSVIGPDALGTTPRSVMSSFIQVPS